MLDKIKANLNVIVYSVVNFLVGLICLLIIKNPVPISIGPRFIVGELGSKWILLLFIFLGLALGFIGLIGKQSTPEQIAFARKRQIGINVLIVLWTAITFFFLCMFTSLDIIGSRVKLNIASMLVCLLGSVLALFSKYFITKQSEDVYYNYRLSLSVFISEICGCVLLAVAAINIFIDNLFFILPLVVVFGLIIYLVPLFVTKDLKKKAEAKMKATEEENAASEEKILSAVNFASEMSSVKDKPKKTKKQEPTEEAIEEKPVELAEEKVVSKTRAKKVAKQNATKNAQKSSGNKTSSKQSTTKSKTKQSAKKTTKSSSNYKGTSKTKNIKK